MEYQTLTVGEERRMITRSQAGCQVARDGLVASLLPWLTTNIKPYLGPNRAYEELLQCAVVGVLKAIDKFDLSYESRLITYATWWIRREVRWFVRKQRSLLSGVARSRREPPWVGALEGTNPAKDGALHHLDENLELREKVDTAQTLLTLLTDVEREWIRQRFEEDLTFREMAKLNHCTPEIMRARVGRLIRRLRAYAHRLGYDESDDNRRQPAG